MRHIAVRTRGALNGRAPQLRRAATLEGKTRPTFNIGSTSSHGSKGHRSSKNAERTTEPGGKVAGKPAHAAGVGASTAVASPPKTTNPPQRRRVVVANTSSEYDTTDTDDESWAEEELTLEDVAKTKEDVQLREAALEVKRLREMFTKVPKRSYSNLNRTRSGLLSQLLNPDPTIFPPNHPYHTSLSTQDFSRLPRDSSRVGAPPGLTTSKSAVALPLAAQVTVGSVSGQQHHSHSGHGSGDGHGVMQRPKGRPQGLEMEDDTDSGDENPDDRIQVSRSVAQQKLAALAGRRDSGKTSSIATTATVTASMATTMTTMWPSPAVAPVRPTLHHFATAPIPLTHPYNLPAPAPPSTPRTTRRQMLQTELSESLRRNLLWERQVSKVNVLGGVRRRQSSGGALGGLRPLTAMTTASVVQVSAKADGSVSAGVVENGNGVAGTDGREKQDEKKRAMARHWSWTDDYHSKGW